MKVKFVIVSLLLFYLIGLSFGVHLSGLSKGDIVETNDEIYEIEEDTIGEEDIPLMPSFPMEMGCSCTCDPLVDGQCILCEGCGADMFIGQGCEGVSDAELIVQTLPHIPIGYADWLMYMNPLLVNFVIHHHHDVASLVATAQTETLAHIVSSVPDFSEVLALMHPHVILTVFQQIPHPCEYLQSIRREDAEMIVHKIGYFSHCLPKTTTTTTSTTGTTTTSSTTTPGPESTIANPEVSEPAASTAPIDVESVFTKEELDYMATKVPQIKALLSKAIPEAVHTARIIHSDLKKIFDDLGEDFIKFLNSPNLVRMKTETLHVLLKSMGKNNLAINAFAEFFA